MVNNEISAGDFISVSLLVVGGGNELVNSVTKALNSVTQKNQYTIVTSKRTLVLYQHEFQLSDQAAGLNTTTTVAYWVVDQSE
jgi:hypothetical protein